MQTENSLCGNGLCPRLREATPALELIEICTLPAPDSGSIRALAVSPPVNYERILFQEYFLGGHTNPTARLEPFRLQCWQCSPDFLPNLFRHTPSGSSSSVATVMQPPMR